MKLTGGQIVVDTLVREGVPYLVGIPGPATLGLSDALLGQDRLQVLQVRHEQAAVHLADGYYRVAGAPLAVLASMGPGAMNTLSGVASCYADSVPVLVLAGSGQADAAGRGLLPELEHHHAGDGLAVFAPVTKGTWRPASAAHVPRVLQRAFAEMLAGRRGPVVVDLPLDVQCDAAEVELAFPQDYRAGGPPVLPEPGLVHRAADLLAGARRPVIVAGGGVLAAGAWDELQRLAELLEAPVLTTMMGKGAFPEDHVLSGLHAGWQGTTCGNALARNADVLLAAGTRFAPRSSSAYRRGVTYNIPPTRLIQLDVDPAEIGKNYPVEIGIVADARAGLAALVDRLQALGVAPSIGGARAGYLDEVKRLREEWLARVQERARDNQKPVTVSRLVAELRAFLRRDAIVLTSSGTTQARWFREALIYEPRTNLTTGGLGTVGWTLPAALGAKLAAPGRQVVGLLGDGDFLMTIQELATAAQYDIPVVLVVANNAGWIALRDLQAAAYGPERAVGAEFLKGREPVTPDLASVARAFGCYSEWITSPEEVRPALERAFAARRPAVLEVMVARDDALAGAPDLYWGDVPVPAYLAERRARYEEERAGKR